MSGSTLAARMRRIEEHFDDILPAGQKASGPAARRPFRVLPALVIGVLLLAAALGLVTSLRFHPTPDRPAVERPRVVTRSTDLSVNVPRTLPEESSPEPEIRSWAARRDGQGRARAGGVRRGAAVSSRRTEVANATPAASGRAASPSEEAPTVTVLASPQASAPPADVDKPASVADISSRPASAVETERAKLRAERRRSFDAIRALRYQ